MSIVIAFSGKRGVGKTTSAEYLERFYGLKPLSFSTRLKELCLDLFPGLEKEQLWGNKKEFTTPLLTGHTPRELMIRLGQFMRFWDPTYWIKQIEKYHIQKVKYVLDDLRYENEAVYLKELGVKLVRINRYPSLNPYKEIIEDPSETDLDNYKEFDFVVEEVDNTSLPILYNKLSGIVEEFGYNIHGK